MKTGGYEKLIKVAILRTVLTVIKNMVSVKTKGDTV